MKAITQIFLYLLIILSSCKENNENRTEKSKPALIKIGYYPTFHRSAETIVNFNEKYLIFYSPSSYNIAPPPPKENRGKLSTEEENEYKEYVNERPELKPFKIKLSDNDIQRIQQVSDTFKSEDFSDKNIKPGFDGMSTNIIILYSDGKLIQINPLNDPNEKQRALYAEVLNLLIEKNTDKNDSIILQKIKRYH